MRILNFGVVAQQENLYNKNWRKLPYIFSEVRKKEIGMFEESEPLLSGNDPKSNNSTIDALSDKVESLERTVQELKFMVLNLEKQLKEYQKIPAPAQKQNEQFSIFNSSQPSKIIPIKSEQEKQNQLIDAIQKGNLDSVKACEVQGALFSHPNNEGIFPLVAAVDSLNVNLVRYVEGKLKGEASNQWEKVNYNKVMEVLANEVPKLLPDNATYGDLNSWYEQHAGMQWCNTYDLLCLKKENKNNWQNDVWSGNRVKTILNISKELWSTVRVSRGDGGFIDSVFDNGEYRLLCPSRKVHDEVIGTILEQLIDLRKNVETEISPHTKGSALY